MKRIIGGVAVVLLLLSLSGAARAEEHETEGTEIVAGVKTWTNTWKRDIPGTEGFKSNTVMLIGPAIEAEFANHVFIEASYLMSASRYKSDDTTVTEEFSRNDLDLAVGYQFNHNVGAFLGYRISAFKEKETGNKETSSGMLLGVRGSVPVMEALSVVGKVTYLDTKMKVEDAAGSTSEKAPGYVAAIGVKYEFVKHLAGTLGYQYETTKTKDTSVKDTFTGFTLDVMYTF